MYFFQELDTLHCVHLINITPLYGTQIYKVKTRRTVNTRLNETADQEPPGKKLAKGAPNRKEPTIPFNLTNYMESDCESGDENNLPYASFSNTSFKFNNSTCQNQSLIDETK